MGDTAPHYPHLSSLMRPAARLGLARAGERDERNPTDQIADGGDAEDLRHRSPRHVGAVADPEDQLQRHDDDVVEQPEREERAEDPRDEELDADEIGEPL